MLIRLVMNTWIHNVRVSQLVCRVVLLYLNIHEILWQLYRQDVFSFP